MWTSNLNETAVPSIYKLFPTHANTVNEAIKDLLDIKKTVNDKNACNILNLQFFDISNQSFFKSKYTFVFKFEYDFL